MNPDDFTLPTIQTHTLHAKRFRLANIIDRQYPVPELGDRMRVELCAHVYTKVIPVVHTEYPTTWWDAFKQRWFPKRLLRRYPPNMTTIHIDVHEMYPTVPSIGEHRAVLTLATTELPKPW